MAFVKPLDEHSEDVNTLLGHVEPSFGSFLESAGERSVEEWGVVAQQGLGEFESSLIGADMDNDCGTLEELCSSILFRISIFSRIAR